MIRICEVAITVDDDQLKKWAEDDETEVEAIIEDIMDDFEQFIDHGIKFEHSTEFYGWVEQCPKCEDSNLLEKFGKGRCKFYTCCGCEYKWSKNYLTKAICAGSHTEI